ncbi:MAG: hypothetical protein LQ350_000085 [Teloschistes chrysophthalmus]|nr:MAG: hypothetical protein LQ350_000085 [Niorma chrysophthalma]
MAKPGKVPKLPVQQLVILALCRLADPISFSSVFPYLPEMIESFNVPKNEVGRWAGITSAVFSLSQAITGVFWGRASDRFGRKPVILIGMICVMSSGLLFGFSKNLPMAIVARSLAGASNGNVGILRTTVAEMVPQKELQPKAFSVMPLMWTIGSIFGPGFGGALANPAARYQIFDNEFFRKFPFALPNIVACLFFFVGLTSGALFLKETLETKKHRRDYGRVVGKVIVRSLRKHPKKQHRLPVDEEQSASLLKRSPTSSISNVKVSKKPAVLPDRPTYREACHIKNSLSLSCDVHLPFKFSGGFGIDSNQIGFLFTLYGIAGTFIQFLIFPPLARRYGVLNCYKLVSLSFPIIYLATPFAVLLPTPFTQQLAIFLIMLIKCFAAIFAFPCITILLTNSAVSLRVLGTLNGVATSVSAAVVLRRLWRPRRRSAKSQVQ